MKRKTTKEILAESFRELAHTKPVDKITIQDITDNCDYSPATFYRHFHDKYDLIAWDYAQSASAITAPLSTEGCTWREMLQASCDYFSSRKEYIRNLLQHTSGHDSFVRYLADTNIQLLSEIITAQLGQKIIPQDLLLCLKVYCYGAVLLTCEWILGDLEISQEHLVDVYENSLPEPLRKYLVKE